MPASSSDLGATSTRSCPGIIVQWPPELELNFNETFPFHRVPIGRSNGDLPFYIELQDGGKKVVAWSKTCTRLLTPFAFHCHECDKVLGRLNRLGSMAEHAEKGTNYRFLSHNQLKDLLVERTKENNDLKLESLNMSRQLATFARKMGDYERLVMAIAENDVPRINALLNTALRNGASVNTIIAQITEAVQGLRSTKGFTQFEHDLSLLIYRIGGNSLLYSLNHALGLPSLRTIGNSAHFVKIAPTFGPVSIDEIRVNIQKVILEPRALVGNTQKKAVVIMMDEVALEEHLDYFPMQNKVGGLCQKHSGTIPLELKAYTSVLTIVDKLRDGTVHFGKEMAVVAVRFGDEKNIYPILAYPTCKRESVEDMEKIYNLLMAAWEELGEQTYGEIRNFATDGDALRRKVGYRMFCKEEIPKDHPLFRILSNLPGLNLFTGPKLILQTFDWRHIVKRDSTVVRQPSGMCVDAGRVVNPHFLAQCLELLDDHDEKSVHKLLNPDDPQDVPRAIDLIEAIISLREIEIPQHNIDLSYTADSVRLLGHVFENFTLPFITPEFNLSRQICMLSTCAHIIFVLFREYRLDFMSNQLYGDTQSTIKNIVFSVAKQQLQDTEVDVNANEDGTDPLEGHFAFMRTAGGHNSAMNYKQGVERNGWACDIQGVYSRWPELAKESRRRRITRTEHKDHLNTSKWNADLKAGNCDLVDCWAQGESKAAQLLSANSRLTSDKYDFPKILATAGVDFLRPWGGDYYPGFADDADRSILNPTPPQSTAEPTDTSDILPGIDSESDSENEESTSEETAVTSEPESITLQELIEDDSPADNLASKPGFNPKSYVEDENGKPIHKASICRLVLNKEFVAKSKDRMDRAAGLGLGAVRCFTKIDSRSLKASASGNMTGSAFIPGDIFLTLIRHTKSVSMAVVKSTAIIHDGRPVRDIPVSTIRNPEARVKLTGQIVHLEAVKATSADLVGDEESTSAVADNSVTWLWTGTFLTRASKMKGTTVLTAKPVIVTVPGTTVELINPAVVDAHGRLSQAAANTINSSGTTWAIYHPYLVVLLTKLSQRLDNLRSLSLVKESLKFPYKSLSGEAALISDRGAALLSDKSSQGCLYCPEIPKNWRAHIGAHILRRLRGSPEPSIKKKARSGEEVGDTMPCGYCGRSGHPECQVKMKPESKKHEIDTKCHHKTNFQYKTADEARTKAGCRNVPIICGLCPTAQRKNDFVPAVWRYNMPEHLRTHHSEYASPQQPEGIPLPHHIWESIQISREEELAMGVKESLVSRVFTEVAPAIATGDATLKRTTKEGGGGKSKKPRPGAEP
ncbi:hypothetical protein R3P38DRAFT_2543278 [Favolaschia claudopus]|uniref:Uncharacterized protein n=1 Tax=Favolaschia claudopus TaxID=2862362 RepID=A0AAW0ASR3_9AGAR